MRNTAVKLKPLSAHAGVEISGVDLRQPLSEAQAGEIRDALNQWGAVFFRDQDLTPVQQVEFARNFGTVQQRTHPTSMTPVDGAPEVAVIERKPDDGRNTGGFWHTDQCFLNDPPLGSVLYAKELPTHGGDTMFAHMGAACAGLSDGLRAALRKMRAVHVRLNYHHINNMPQWGVTVEEMEFFKEKYVGIEATHPVIGVQPESGQEILYLNPIYTDRFEGWTRDESQPLIQQLCARATRPENICRFRWEPGSLAMWDNRAMLHYALDDYPGQGRVMHRCVVLGPWLTAAKAA